METTTNQQHHQQSRTKNRGFASMNSDRQKEIARKGGRAAHEKGKAHEFTSDEARAAGRKGGEKVSVNRRHMAEIGRRGGRSSAQRRRPVANQPGSEGGASMHRVPETAGAGTMGDAAQAAGAMQDTESAATGE
jgi:uncharacterized protein